MTTTSGSSLAASASLSAGAWHMLASAERWTDHANTDGVSPRGAGEHAQIAALQRRGFVEYVDHGGRADGDNGDAEVAIYAITDAGRKALAARGAGAHG